MNKKQIEAYKVGFKTGLTWKDSWIPGGPIVFYAKPSDKQSWQEICQASQEENKAWLRGWHDGKAQQVKG